MQIKMRNFSSRVLNQVKCIPKGKVLTYKILAEKVGYPKACRSIGNVLNKNNNLVKIPCHRVVMSDGSVGGYQLGEKRKISILKKEGIKINKAGKIKNLENFLFKI